NGDGFDDIVLSVISPPSTGQISLFPGSPTGPPAAPSIVISSTHAGDDFGFPVASAGDVNGDGYADVIVGAIWTDGSTAGVGAASGVSTSAAWIGTGVTVCGAYGLSVSSAGDFNGDGRSDLLVSAPSDSVLAAPPGAAYIYYGNNSNGLARLPRQARHDGSAP